MPGEVLELAQREPLPNRFRHQGCALCYLHRDTGSTAGNTNEVNLCHLNARDSHAE